MVKEGQINSKNVVYRKNKSVNSNKVYHKKKRQYSLIIIVILLLIFSFVNIYQAYSVLSFQKQITGKATGGIVGLTILADDIGWDKILAPEGVFEPLSSLSGTHVETFSIKFINLSIGSSDTLVCYVWKDNMLYNDVSVTGLTLSDEDYSLNYTKNIRDYQQGMYFLKVYRNNNFILSKKFIKE